MGIEIRGMAPLLQVFDMPTSIAFYRDVLGFEVVTTSNPGAERFDWALLRLNGIELMGEFDGFPGVPALAGQGWQRNGERAQGDGVIGGDNALVAQAEASRQIEAARQGAEVAHGFCGGASETLVVVDAELGKC